MPHVLLATTKPFAAAAEKAIISTLENDGHKVTVLKGYKSQDALIAAVPDADSLIVRSDKIDAAVLAAAPKLKLVVRAGAGVDTIDLASATKNKVVVMNTPGQNSNAVAEMAFGMMIMHIRNRFDGSSGSELRGKTLGLYGFGWVPVYMNKIAQALEMKVMAYDPYLSDERMKALNVTRAHTVEEVFGCQYVSIHVPATKETKRSVGVEMLSRLPKNGVLLNTARDDIINEPSMLEALQKRPDIAYLTDVQPKTVKDWQAALGDRFSKQVFMTPKKMGAQTAEANTNAGIAAANQTSEFFKSGSTKFQVNKAKL